MTSEPDNDTDDGSRGDTSSNSTQQHTVTSGEGFREKLQELVSEANSNGVDVRGSWPLFQDDTSREWDVEITSLSRQSTAYVQDTGSPVASIIEAVAAREGVETTDLPPLHEAIAPEVLDTLRQRVDDTDQYVQFQYYGYKIIVYSDGSIILEN